MAGAAVEVGEQALEDVGKTAWHYLFPDNDGGKDKGGSTGGGSTNAPKEPSNLSKLGDILSAGATGTALGGPVVGALYAIYTGLKDYHVIGGLGDLAHQLFGGGTTGTGTTIPKGGNGGGADGGKGTGNKTSDAGGNGPGGGGGTSTGGAGQGQGNGTGGNGGGGTGGTGGTGTGVGVPFVPEWWKGGRDHDGNGNYKPPKRTGDNLGNNLLNSAPPPNLLNSLAARRSRYTPFDLGYTSSNESLLQRWSGAPGAVSGTTGRLLLTSGGNT